MKQDTTAYLAMAVFGLAAVGVMVVGVVTGKTTLGLMGLVLAAYPMMIGVAASAKRGLGQNIEELRAEVRDLRESLRGK